jgi:superfamily I DNA/RNA helicase
MIELNDEQLEIVNTTHPRVVVVASAAAGKTAVLVERVRHLLTEGVNPKEIVLITFTNAAAEELGERLGKPAGLFIGTIHSYANYLLRSGGEDTTDILDNEEFDKLFPLIKQNPQCIRHVEHLLLDESQDSNKLHFEFLLDMVKPANYMLVGDHKQSIYRWNGAFPDYIIGLTKRPDVMSYDLYKNYRNGEKILDFAKSIIRLCGWDYNDDSEPMSPERGRVVEVEYNPSAIAKSIAAFNAEYGSWFVLTRTNAEIDVITRELAKAGVPYDTFKRAQLDNKELNKKMKENTVKVLTIHTAKGLEADNVVVIGSKFYNVEEKCISYVAATRARKLLVWTRTKNNVKYKPNQVSNWER